MPFDLTTIQKELTGRPLTSPIHHELAVAVISDVHRAGGTAPPSDLDWQAWKKAQSHALWVDQMGILAHFLQSSASLYEGATSAARRGPRPTAAWLAFFEAIAPLTAELVRQNPHRQAELLRRYAELLSEPISGETAAESQAALERLDYRRALADLEHAEAQRKKEETERQRLLAEAEAQRKAAEARGGYE